MTKIEWVKNPDGSPGITVNSKTGCRNHTPEGLCLGGMFPCYAFKLANGRLKSRYLANLKLSPTQFGDCVTNTAEEFHDPFYPRWWPERLEQIKGIKKPTGIFLDDMSDWMGDYWPSEWTMAELQMMRDNSQHRIYTLTKQPQNLIKFSPFPENCFVGVTATNGEMYQGAMIYLDQLEAKVKYISFEPLLDRVQFFDLPVTGLDWLIIGACTGTYGELWNLVGRLYPDKEDAQFVRAMRIKELSKGKHSLQPRIEWVREIVEAADKAGIKIFLKDNLKPLIDMHYPQESDLVPNHNKLVRMKHPKLCSSCKGENCDNCGCIWGLRQEMP